MSNYSIRREDHLNYDLWLSQVTDQTRSELGQLDADYVARMLGRAKELVQQATKPAIVEAIRHFYDRISEKGGPIGHERFIILALSNRLRELKEKERMG